MLRALFPLVLLLAPGRGADLAAGISAVIESSAASRGGHWGILVRDLPGGRPVFQRNADRFFVPASNIKLFTTSLALMRLGPAHRFHTVVRAEGSDLVLVGGGDPNLSGRVLPYDPAAPEGDPMRVMDDLAAQVAARGVRRVAGDLIGDDTAYLWSPYPEGWAADDPIWEYGAPVSALVFNDSMFRLTVSPGGLAVEPAAVPYFIDNRVRAVARGPGKIKVDREPGSKQVRVWGTIPREGPPHRELLGVDQPALYAAQAFADALARRGIALGGGIRVRHWYPNEAAPPPSAGVELARRESAPLLEDLRVIVKESQNLHAEMALHAVGRARRGSGTRDAGLAELESFLAEAGVKAPEYHIVDGSGLSRLNVVTPAAVVKLLAFMYRSPQRDNWLSLLPVGGVDGTLKNRFTGSSPRVRAKTGTMTHVSGLAGYVERRGGGLRAFAIFANNYNAPDFEIRALIDKIVMLIAE